MLMRMYRCGLLGDNGWMGLVGEDIGLVGADVGFVGEEFQASLLGFQIGWEDVLLVGKDLGGVVCEGVDKG